MKVLGIYGSPRKGGNSERLLDEALRGAESVGAEVITVRPCALTISGCVECGGCDKTGKCVVKDDMGQVYPLLEDASVIILSVPIFFYGPPAQAKALIDRCQAAWCKRALEKKTPEKRRLYDGGRGYLIGVGATKGSNLFEGAKLVAKYFYDALDMTFEDGLYVNSVEGKDAILEKPDALQEAFELGRRVAKETD